MDRKNAKTTTFVQPSKGSDKDNKDINDPPTYDIVCPPSFDDQQYLPTIMLKIRYTKNNDCDDEELLAEEIRREEQIKNEDKNSQKDINKKILKEENHVDYNEIVHINLVKMKELNKEIMEISNCISIIFNEIEV